ncbi:aminotransferase class I/II-fold pyridoxal phosphate-dependent enzyme [Oleiagrimonas sp.]|jgi:alanine-synthesizing transaminase|uniref:aminotransferase class I/II-fold pyridoxal phosphate-dependent enzyme n=1 Tax=Oleiagrimonas sp. TaxID=2010330 RepID=UPI002611A9CB|nr:aminotransferase class I/II-fold pyridoxal phosphate-dependent enzyme [Oleiagrimonas sp.]MDA3913464.1 aminotransferase class I/II-fold pyridoxal phosphate-dependent enzyme [Oleiagrimonas sp.]
MPVKPIHSSSRLVDVHYEIRGTLARRAREMEANGASIMHLNIGDTGRFGFRAPAHLVEAIQAHLGESDGYAREQGIREALDAIVARQHARGVCDVTPERTFIGNGVSELIDITLRALLDPGDEVLLPSPDYPLWSAATVLNGGRATYYQCTADNDHQPDLDELQSLIGPRTRAIVLVNPNNPTGAVYPRKVLEKIVAMADHHGLMLLCDEIYDELVYDGTEFQPIAPLAGQVPCLTFSGLSKVHRACGFRIGWMTLSGSTARTAGLRDALQLLAALRLCANVPAQWAVRPALEGPDTIGPLLAPGGRLHSARQAALDGVATSAHLEMVKPRGAMYAYPAVRADRIPEFDDNTFALRLLEDESVLLAPGSSFNVPQSRHLRLTLLPEPDQLREVFVRIERVLDRMTGETPGTLRASA